MSETRVRYAVEWQDFRGDWEEDDEFCSVPDDGGPEKAMRFADRQRARYVDIAFRVVQVTELRVVVSEVSPKESE